MMPNLTVKDLEKLQVNYPDYQMELVGGEVIVMIYQQLIYGIG